MESSRIPALRLPAADLVLYLPSPDQRDEAAYRTLFIDGPAALLAALPRAPSRLVFVSSTAVYGDLGGGWADEDTPALPEKPVKPRWGPTRGL